MELNLVEHSVVWMDVLMVGEKVDSTAGKWVLRDSKKAE
jgi:hypothetical protein